MKWRVFVGLHDEHDGWAHLDKSGLTWAIARSELARMLGPFLVDECPDCRQQGTEAMAALVAAEDPAPFYAEVDGETYEITPEN